MSTQQTWDGETRRAPIPPGRDPFVNTPFLSLGVGEDGKERFWTSSWNYLSGTTGILITEDGQERTYRFGQTHPGFYSAAQEDQNTLWLCSDLARVVRLDLKSGEFEEFETGAPSALVFQGMSLDHATGKLYACAFPPPKTVAFSFDFKNRRPVKVYDDICEEHYMRTSFPNGDGTHSSLTFLPGICLMQWNPQEETLEPLLLHELAGHSELPLEGFWPVFHLISDDEGRRYFPHFGWYEPKTRKLSPDGPRPEREMNWFARRGDWAWGIETHGNDPAIGLWDLKSGEVREVCTLTDCTYHAPNLSADGKIVAVSTYGEFTRRDGHTGQLEISRWLPTENIGNIDCLRRIDEDRVLGTTFITQRFWETNFSTGKGFDCGRAAPGAGEVLKTWKLGGKIYMASYTGGELTEYDPAVHPHFPENPRVVSAPQNALRPIAAADDGRNIYYSCSHKYGNLGCVLTKYDTATGLNLYCDDLLPGQAIWSMRYDAATDTLLAATTRHADCQSATPTAEHGYFIRLNARDLSVIQTIAVPPQGEYSAVVGMLEDGQYLCEMDDIKGGRRWFAAPLNDFRVPEFADAQPSAITLEALLPTARAGWFVGVVDGRLQLWDWHEQKCLRDLHSMDGVQRYSVDGDSVLLATSKEIIALENCLVMT